jgi:hypothetical protein
MVACKINSLPLCKLLYEYGADVGYCREKAPDTFTIACQYSSLDIINYIKEIGGDKKLLVEKRNASYWLHNALHAKRDIEIIEHLLKWYQPRIDIQILKEAEYLTKDV